MGVSEITINENILTISQNDKDVAFINGLCKFVFIAPIIIILVMVLDDSIQNSFKNWMVVIFFTFFLIYMVNFIGKFAHKIVINPNKNSIEFFLQRNKGNLHTNLGAIKKIHIGLYITFFVEGRKVKYNDARNKELIELLTKWSGQSAAINI